MNEENQLTPEKVIELLDARRLGDLRAAIDEMLASLPAEWCTSSAGISRTPVSALA